MIVAGTKALASLSPALNDPDAALLPDFVHAREANYEVAVAVATQAIEEGSANVEWGKDQVREKVKEKLWLPEYDDLVYDPDGEV
jgi:malate dehydrogenase (oxaloacetate-decarboxylating)